MVKRTQTIRRQQPTNCLSVFDRFMGLVFKELTCALFEFSLILVLLILVLLFYQPGSEMQDA